ncbi:MAG: tRNA threonylcarbamoyladenosine dehydratase [Chitinophagales bacterium]|jgi:tRNA A37 threonylcarbamoyladenosine dehydratase|nr:tRNA threonylcarbamoyladenosine dehydratase [Chitinophagales bacterium]
MSFLSRTEILLGQETLTSLSQKNVLIVGLGGVGSYAFEALVRSGIGNLTIVDADIVQESNINRQLQALHSTIGQKKALLLEQRGLDINPNCHITSICAFMEPGFTEELFKQKFDFVLDCIDTLTPKIELITYCKRNKIKFISSMGAGGKFDPSKIQITDLDKTRNCYFARDVRKRLRAQKFVYGIKVVYSDEFVPKRFSEKVVGEKFKKSYYGTISYIPAMFGMTMASYVIRKLANL